MITALHSTVKPTTSVTCRQVPRCGLIGPTVNGTNVLLVGEAAAQTSQVYCAQAGTAQVVLAVSDVSIMRTNQLNHLDASYGISWPAGQINGSGGPYVSIANGSISP